MTADREWSEFLQDTMRKVVGEELWLRSVELSDEELEGVVFRTLFQTYKVEDSN